MKQNKEKGQTPSDLTSMWNLAQKRNTELTETENTVAAGLGVGDTGKAQTSRHKASKVWGREGQRGGCV